MLHFIYAAAAKLALKAHFRATLWLKVQVTLATILRAGVTLINRTSSFPSLVSRT